MRYAILADIHGNLEALTAVLEAVENESVDRCFCLGDIVGYGANPEECVRLVREAGCSCVAGNHDHAAIGRLDLRNFNLFAQHAVVWTGEHISSETREFFRGLPLVEFADSMVLVHGSLIAPETFNYIQTVRDATNNFAILDEFLCFCAHSHVPLTFFDSDPLTYSLEDSIELDDGERAIINVGSVGQPRDRCPDAAYALYDTEAELVEIRRVPYDFETAAEKILDAGLPEELALRLPLGR
ncbi:MAG: metallophosphoesterase family protein [Planctomycetota bacterium]